MKHITLLMITGLMMVACNIQTGQKHDTESEEHVITTFDSPRDGILIHITAGYEDPHRVLMPLKMAVMMAADKDVLAYMDIHTVELLVKGAKDIEHKGFDSFQSYIQQLTEKKVGLYACPTCLEVAGFKPEDLMEGVQLANKDRFFDFTEGRILTIDY